MTNALLEANAMAPAMVMDSFMAQGPWEFQIHRACAAKQIPAETQRSAASPNGFHPTWLSLGRPGVKPRENELSTGSLTSLGLKKIKVLDRMGLPERGEIT